MFGKPRPEARGANATIPLDEADGGRSFPVNWGAFKGNRINVTAWHGKLWLHVHRDRAKVSFPMHVDQAELFRETLRMARDAAATQRMKYWAEQDGVASEAA